MTESISDPSQLEVINWNMEASHPFCNARSSVNSIDLNSANTDIVGEKAVA